MRIPSLGEVRFGCNCERSETRFLAPVFQDALGARQSGLPEEVFGIRRRRALFVLVYMQPAEKTEG
jgi:hypothetical protein